MLVNQLEIINACTETTEQCERSSYRNYNIVVVVASYHALLFELLLVNNDHNCTRTGFEVRACTVSSPHVRKKNSFHKLICVMQMFMRKNFMAQCHPQSIFNIELFSKYCIYVLK